MKLSNFAMITCIQSINKFATSAYGKTAFALVRNRRILQDELKDFSERQNELIKKYGKQDEDGNYRIDKDNADSIKNYEAEFAELLKMEMDVNVYQLDESDFNIESFPDNANMADYDIVHTLIVYKNNSEKGV